MCETIFFEKNPNIQATNQLLIAHILIDNSANVSIEKLFNKND